MLRPAETLDLGRLVRTFTLRTSDGFVENFGPDLIARVGEEAPGVRLRFVQKPDKDSAPLRDGSVDLETGVVGETTGPEVRAQALFRDRFIGVVRAGHPLSQGEITPARYAAGRHILVSRRGLDSGPIDEALAALGLERRDRHDRRRLLGRAGAGARLRPDRQRSRAAHRQACAPACTAFALPVADAGDHRLAALASAARRRSGASLAARLRSGRLCRAGRRSEPPPCARTRLAYYSSINYSSMDKEAGVRVFKTRRFAQFARRARISDGSLCEAVQRAERGLIDADLGGGVIKQRAARPGQRMFRRSGHRFADKNMRNANKLQPFPVEPGRIPIPHERKWL